MGEWERGCSEGGSVGVVEEIVVGAVAVPVGGEEVGGREAAVKGRKERE